MAESNLPTTVGELEVKNEFPATSEWISFWTSKLLFFQISNFVIRKINKQRKKQLIAQSDRAECVDIINYL